MEEKITYAKIPKDGEAWDVVVIGSGPAALTSAIYTTRGAASTLIIGGEAWGGQLMLTTTVDNYPGFPQGINGPDLMTKMRSQAERFGCEFVQRYVDKVDFSKKPFVVNVSDTSYLAKSVIIATGAKTKWLEVPGERELIGKGVSSCAPCDAPFFKDKKVAVVGGGDSAMEEALVLTRYASEVTIIHRGSEFKASAAMQMKVSSNPKIKTLFNLEVVRFEGVGKLERVVLKNNKSGESSELSVDGVFVSIGHLPDTEIFKNIVGMDEKGYIQKRDSTSSSTSIPGVFVAGDVHDFTYRQAITAAGFGCQAALEAIKYLESSE